MKTEMTIVMSNGEVVTRITYWRPCACGCPQSVTFDRNEYRLGGQRTTVEALWARGARP